QNRAIGCSYHRCYAFLWGKNRQGTKDFVGVDFTHFDSIAQVVRATLKQGVDLIRFGSLLNNGFSGVKMLESSRRLELGPYFLCERFPVIAEQADQMAGPELHLVR